MTRPLLAALALCCGLAPRAAAAPKPRLLYIGDSHTAQTFGQTLDGLLRLGLPAYDVETYGICSSDPSWFLAPADLPPEMASRSGRSTTCGYFVRHPQADAETGLNRPAPILSNSAAPEGSVAVIALGTNLSTWDEALGWWGLSSVTALARKVRSLGMRCIWVGPPQALDIRWKDLPGAATQSRRLSAAVRKAAEGCDFIDSIAITERLPDALRDDGLHYKPDASRAWARAVYDRVAKSLLQSGPGP